MSKLLWALLFLAALTSTSYAEQIESTEPWCETVRVYDAAGTLRTNCTIGQFSVTFNRTTSIIPVDYYPSSSFQDMSDGNWSVCVFQNHSSGYLRAFVAYSSTAVDLYSVTIIPVVAKPSHVTR